MLFRDGNAGSGVLGSAPQNWKVNVKFCKFNVLLRKILQVNSLLQLFFIILKGDFQY